jgi:hypothetical protein
VQLEFGWYENDALPAERPTPAGTGPGKRLHADKQQPVAGARDAAEAAVYQQAERLRTTLCQMSGLRVLLRITDNSSTMLSVKYDGNGRARLSLHHMFLDAPFEIHQALSAWLKRPRSKKPGAVIDTFIRDNKHRIRVKVPRRLAPAELVTRGRFHDLAAIFADLNAKFFDNTITAGITWGKMPRRLPRRTIRFGSYAPHSHLIRIHPLLDQENVPRFFVRYIVFHEMLHAHLGIEETPNGRRRIHPPRFVEMEKEYPEYRRALRWMENPDNMARMFRRR